MFSAIVSKGDNILTSCLPFGQQNRKFGQLIKRRICSVRKEYFLYLRTTLKREEVKKMILKVYPFNLRFLNIVIMVVLGLQMGDFQSKPLTKL